MQCDIVYYNFCMFLLLCVVLCLFVWCGLLLHEGSRSNRLDHRPSVAMSRMWKWKNTTMTTMMKRLGKPKLAFQKKTTSYIKQKKHGFPEEMS